MNKGISQELRKNIALEENYISIDERSVLDMVQFTMDFSNHINFYDIQNKVIGNWRTFLLNDSAFIIAMIASTDTEKLKMDVDNVEYHSDQTNEIEILKHFTETIIKLITHWAKLLKYSNYNGFLRKEIEKLLNSVSEKYSSVAYNPDLKILKEIYENVYGNVVFIKEKAAENIELEILSISNHHPHVGLLYSFFLLFKNAQHDINTITKKHLDFYYLDLLQQKRKNINSGTAIIGLKIQPGAKELFLNEGDKCEFIFEGQKQISYKTDSSTQINTAEIAEIRTLYKSDDHPFSINFDEDNLTINRLFEASIPYDGKSLEDAGLSKYSYNPATLGEEKILNDTLESNIKLSDVGIVVSSPALILENGKRKINLTFKITPASYIKAKTTFNGLVSREIEQLNLAGSDKEKIEKGLVSKFFGSAFIIYITGNEGWNRIEYYKVKLDGNENILTIDIPLTEQDILTSYDSEIHDGGIQSYWPCIKLLLNNETQYHPYKVLRDIVIEYIIVEASASDVSNLVLSNSTGNLDSSIPFELFGPTPVPGSFLRLQNPLILQKNLANLELNMNWLGLPQTEGGFMEYYRAYPTEIYNSIFKATIRQKRNVVHSSAKQSQQEFELFNTKEDFLSDKKKINVDLENLNFKNQIDQTKIDIDDNSSSLFIVLTSPEIAFGHQTFPNLYAELALKSSRFKRKKVALPNQPYTPSIERVSVNYSNFAKEIMLRKQDEGDSDIKLFHIFPTGSVQVFPGPVKSQSYFLPQINYKGNLLLGLVRVEADDVVSIGFELIPAVYIHTVINVPKVEWEYLVNNEWEPLAELLLEDSTDGLIKSGIVKIELPNIVQFNNTRLPQGKFWIRAVYNGEEDINSKIINVFAQAVSLVSDNSTSENLPDTKDIKIEKINFVGKKGIAEITGPFAFELNDPIENEESFYSRISEQMRHKNRAVSNWDVERIVLDKFKNIEKVRVYGRNSHPKELVKGSNMQIVLIPRNNTIGKVRLGSNRVDFSTLKEVKKYVNQFVSPYVQVEVSNPVYEYLKVRCIVKFNNFQKRGYLRKALNDELISYLSPDIKNDSIEKGFDESISKTEILNFIESRPYVNFVSQFSVLQLVEVQGKYKIIDTAKITRVQELRTISAYAILTSAPEHQIDIIPEEISEKPEISGIGDLGIETDFVISDDNGKYN